MFSYNVHIGMKIIAAIFVGIFLVLYAGLNWDNQKSSEQVKVEYVIDGDTIIVEGKRKVRYIGVDAPEIIYATNTGDKSYRCFAKESLIANEKIVEGKTVKLVKDVSDKDKYGRLLRYVYSGDIFVNEYLVKNGFAVSEPIFPNLEYSRLFYNSQKMASDKKIGLWSKCAK